MKDKQILEKVLLETLGFCRNPASCFFDPFVLVMWTSVGKLSPQMSTLPMNENVLNRPTLIKFSRHPPTFDNLNGIPVNETPSLSITSISFTLCRRRNFIANFFFLSLPPFFPFPPLFFFVYFVFGFFLSNTWFLFNKFLFYGSSLCAGVKVYSIPPRWNNITPIFFSTLCACHF